MRKPLFKACGLWFLGALLLIGCDNNQDEIDALEAKIDQIVTQDFQSKIATLGNQINDIAKSLTDSRGEVSNTIASEAKKLQDAIDDLKTQVETGQTRLTKASNTVIDLGNAVSNLQSQIAGLESRVPTTAKDVVDDETLKAFVEWAKAEIEAAVDVTDAAEIELKLREKSEFNDGDDTYLIKVFERTKDLLTHGKDQTLEGISLSGHDDFNELFDKSKDGGFVTYKDGGEEKKAYAVQYKDAVTNQNYVLIGGYTGDLSDLGRKFINIEKPSITASDVRDRESLVQFVKETAELATAQFKQGVSVPQLRNTFRKEGGHWKSGSVYVWIVSNENINLFHGANLNLEHRFSNFDRVDKTGQRFVEILINGARENGDEGQFLEYFYDSPSDPDDDDESAKLGFAYAFDLGLPSIQGKFVIGSGIYTGEFKTTAEEVKNDDPKTLGAFVQWAKTEIEQVTDVTEAAQIELKLREKGEFNDGDDTYLLKVLKKTGDLLTHGTNRSFEGLNLLEFKDENGKNAIGQLLRKEGSEGGFVKYKDGGEEKQAYAVGYKDRITNDDYVLIGGYTQDLTNAERKTISIPKPDTTASDVKDRETLVKFVKEAASVASEQLQKGVSVPQLRNTFREEGGHWKSGSVYIWIVSEKNINLFHGANLNLEHRFANLDRLDKNGKRFIDILISGARQNGEKGQFLEYFYDNPNNDQDDDESAKLGFAYSFSFPWNPEQKLVIGSGIYTGDL